MLFAPFYAMPAPRCASAYVLMLERHVTQRGAICRQYVIDAARHTRRAMRDEMSAMRAYDAR